MFDQFFKLIDVLPKVSKNWKAIVFLVLSGLFVGITGFPLWLVYRNETEVLSLISSLGSRKIDPHPREDLLLIRNLLQELLKESDASRVIFGIIEDGNRIILVEVYRPLEDPLPLGFQTVYKRTEDYRPILNTLRLSSCLYLGAGSVGSYFRSEIEISNATGYLTCPSESNWFLASYLTNDDTVPENTVLLESTVKDIEDILESGSK